ncbi:MAG: gas vesicle protein K [Planctomycetes bacterium]|nr:gas vesicle protein K [Planctomycetota bacterium]
MRTQVLNGETAEDELLAALRKGVKAGLGGRVNLRPERPEKGLAKLVLTLIDLLRKLCEKQALSRVEAGSLSSEEVERLGVAFLRLEEKMQELKRTFGLEDEDLNINLGPLGDLM